MHDLIRVDEVILQKLFPRKSLRKPAHRISPNFLTCRLVPIARPAIGDTGVRMRVQIANHHLKESRGIAIIIVQIRNVLPLCYLLERIILCYSTMTARRGLYGQIIELNARIPSMNAPPLPCGPEYNRPPHTFASADRSAPTPTRSGGEAFPPDYRYWLQC
jgi:hypothetical protein